MTELLIVVVIVADLLLIAFSSRCLQAPVRRPPATPPALFDPDQTELAQ